MSAITKIFMQSQAAPTVDDLFAAAIRTSDGNEVTVTTDIDMTKGFLLWSKGRSGATDHALYDSARGVTKDLVSNSTVAETPQAQGLTAVSTDGHTIGTLAKMNTNLATYIDWVFRKAPSFFDVEKVTKVTGANKTIDFALLKVLGAVLVKRIDDTGAWYFWHKDLTAGKLLILNTTAAETPLGHVTIAGTVVTLVDGVITDGDYIVYAWAHAPGINDFIRCGSYLGASESIINTYTANSSVTGLTAGNTLSLYGRGGTGTTTYHPAVGNPSYPSGLPVYIAPVAYKAAGFATVGTFDFYGGTGWTQAPAITITRSGSSFSFVPYGFSDAYGYRSLYTNSISDDGTGYWSGIASYATSSGTALILLAPSFPWEAEVPAVAQQGLAAYPNGLPAYVAAYNTYTTGASATAVVNGTTLTWPGGYGGTAAYSTQSVATGATTTAELIIPSGGSIQITDYTAGSPEINLGWTPQAITIKNRDNTGNYQMIDSARGLIVSGDDQVLQSNLANEETSLSSVVPTATGFTVDGINSDLNTLNENYVYIAIRESDA